MRCPPGSGATATSCCARTSTRCARCPWQEGTVVCLADVAWEDGSDVVVSPRQVLRAQLARLAERGWSANAGTELEFIVFRDTYEQAWHKGYRELEPANLYNVDYSLLGTARVEPLIRRIRNEHGGRRDARARTRRASATSASTRSTSATATRCGPPTSTRSTRTAPRRSRRRRAWRSRSWPSSTSARATRATSTSRWPTSRDRCSTATARCSTPSSRASWRACAS